MTAEHDDVTRYAAAVRAALADIPEPDRADLLEDLEDHLAEVAAESDEPLAERLGPPEEYAAQLRAAYGADAHPSAGPSWRARMREGVAAARGSRAYQHLRGLRIDLRPVWWVARGYIVAMAAMMVFTGYLSAIPVDLGPLLLVVLAAWGSVLLGRRTPRLRQGWRGAVLAGNVLVVLLAVPLMGELSDYYYDPPPRGGAATPTAYGAAPPGEPALGYGVTNIYPYSKDGEPLEDVFLYDQNGRPILVTEELLRDNHGLRPDYPIGADGRPIRNAYPFDLQPQPQWPGHSPAPTGRPRVAIPQFPSPSPTASPTASPTPTESPIGN